MWLRDDIPIEVSRVAYVPLGFQLIDDLTDLPIDITGMSVSCKVADADGSNAIASPEVIVQSSENGEFDIIFNGGDYISFGEKETVNLSYQVMLSDSQISLIIVRGPLVLVPGVQ